jgi:hypothetical protein
MRYLYGFAAAALLAGCGGGTNNQAVQACSDEIASKLSGKSYKIDSNDMAAKARVEGDTVAISSTVTFDAGLPSESAQTFDCRARLVDGKAQVISFNFKF